MSKEKERLMNLLNENKISEEEYKLLSGAIGKKSSAANLLFSLLINPFQKVAGFYALILGLIVIFCMSYFGLLAKMYFPGILDVLNASVVKNLKIQMSFFLLLYQNLVSWLILAALFFIAAKIFKQKKLRLIDFLGTTALARFPYLILTLFLWIMRVVNPSFMEIDLTKGIQLHPSIATSMFAVVVIVCVLWQVTTYFYALKVSSGLAGKKLWISFICAIILGEAISSPLSTIFF